MKKSKILSLCSALALVAVTIILIAVAAALSAGVTDSIHPSIIVMMVVAVAVPFVCYPIIGKIEKLEEEGK